MDPGILVANVGHGDEILVQPGLAEGVLEQGLMGTGAAGGHHHPVEALGVEHFLEFLQRIRGAGKGGGVGVDHLGQGAGISRHRRHIDDAGDIDAAVAYEYTDARVLLGNVFFLGILLLPGQSPPNFGQQRSGGRGGCGRLADGLGDVLGSLTDPTGVNALATGGNQVKRRSLHEAPLVDGNAHGGGQFPGIGLGRKAYG